MASSPAPDLVSLGFTEVEATAYCELLRSGPSTGYRLAAAIDRAPSNMYQTLDSLRRKGAIVADDAEPRVFRAVGPPELVGSLERGFKHRAQGALERLRAIGRTMPDDRFYGLRSVEQVFDRARDMVGRATDVVLFDLFPEPFRVLQGDLERAAGKRVMVGGIGYGEVPKVRRLQVWNHPWHVVEQAWPGQQVTVVADAKECLIALLTHDGAAIRHALWTDSLYLSCLHHSGLACEIQVAAMKRKADDPLSKLGLLSRRPPGLRALSADVAKGARSRKADSR